MKDFCKQIKKEIIMKKGLFAMVVLTLCIMSCEGDSNEFTPKEETPNYKIHDGNIVGVWKNGDYFVSFSTDNFNSAVLSRTYLDEGIYSVVGDTIVVRNDYFSHSTKYVVESITSSSISLKISYVDYKGIEQKTTGVFSKTNDEPCSKNHNLVGKSYYSMYASKNGAQHWNKLFQTYNTMSCTRTDVGSYNPYLFYYIYLPPRMYFYIKRNSTFDFDAIKFCNIEFDANNQIAKMGDLYGETF